jgi:hypothetical protein
MATIIYTNTITQVDDSTINFELLSVGSGVTAVDAVNYSRFTNQITTVIADMSASFPDNPLPNDYNLTSTVAGMGSVFGDSVYRYESNFDSGSDDYESDQYFLVTTAIDAAILVLPITTDAEIARKNYIVALRAEVSVNFASAAYSTANAKIEALTELLFNLTTASLTFVATLPSADQITLTGSNSFLSVYRGGWYNVLTNTLTTVEYPYTWNFTSPSQSKNVIQLFDYPDGVYQNYSSVLASYVGIGPNTGTLYEGTSYLLVTTTIDNQISLLQANYDPNNTAEAIALAELLQLQTDIATAYAANDYTETNALIAQAQAILENGLSRSISAALTSDADMSVFFTVPPAMPVGTYTEGAGTITNTLTGVAFTFDGFPLDSTDLTQSLNSEELGFGVDFPDGVYQIVVTWLVDGLLFTAECYLVVTTDWQCCIDKAAGKKCGKLNTALMQANLTNAVRMVALYSDVNTANALISEGNRECSTCGCGCS